MDWQASLGARQQHDATHVPQHQGGAGVDGVKHVLDGQGFRVQALDEGRDAGVNVTQLLRERAPLRGGDHAHLDQLVAPAIGLDDPVPGAERAGIDAQDDQWPCAA